MSIEQVTQYIADHKAEWDACVQQVASQIGLTPQAFELQRPYMLVITDKTPGYIAWQFMQAVTPLDENANSDELLNLTAGIREIFRNFNSQLDDELRWRELGTVTTPCEADVYCAPFDIISKKKYTSGNLSSAETDLDLPPDLLLNGLMFFLNIFFTIFAWALFPVRYFLNSDKSTKTRSPWSDDGWKSYIANRPASGQLSPVTPPADYGQILDAIFSAYELHNIKFTTDELHEIRRFWEDGISWSNNPGRKIEKLGRDGELPKSYSYETWVPAINNIFSRRFRFYSLRNRKYQEKLSTNCYMLFKLLLPIMPAGQLMALNLIQTAQKDIIDLAQSQLPRNRDEAEFIIKAISCVHDMQIKRRLFSLIIMQRHNFQGLEDIQASLVKSADPELLNIPCTQKGGSMTIPGQHLLVSNMTNTTNRHILQLLATHGSGYISKVANQKLLGLEKHLS